MTPKMAIRSAAEFLLVFAFLGCGIFLSCLPYLPKTLSRLTHLLKDQPHLVGTIGMGITLLALFFLLLFYSFNRGRQMVIRMGVKTNLKLIHAAADLCFKEKFSQKIALKEVVMTKGDHLAFSITAPKEVDEVFYEQVQDNLTLLLSERFGYVKPFEVIGPVIDSDSKI